MLGDITGERRGEVVAQRQPLLVVVLEREYALVRPVLVGQEFAERLGQLDERRLDRLEAIKLIDVADLRHHRLGGGDVGLVAVGEAPRQRGADKRGVGFGHAALYLQALRPEQVGFKSTRVMMGPCGSTGKPNRVGDCEARVPQTANANETNSFFIPGFELIAVS